MTELASKIFDDAEDEEKCSYVDVGRRSTIAGQETQTSTFRNKAVSAIAKVFTW